MPHTATIMDTTDNLCVQGFEAYHQHLVTQFSNNRHNNLTYRQFSQRTQRATMALACAKEAMFYTVAYAWTHYLSMCHVFNNSLDVSQCDEVVLQVIDYGCGQGVASLALLDYLALMAQGKPCRIELLLIELSCVALEIAEALCLHLAQANNIEVTISTQNCTLDEVVFPTLDNDSETLHLMSNVLDIDTVQDSLSHLTNAISAMAGQHILLASGPTYHSNTQGFERLIAQMPDAHNFLNETISFTHDEYRVTQHCWQTKHTEREVLGLTWSNLDDCPF